MVVAISPSCWLLLQKIHSSRPKKHLLGHFFTIFDPYVVEDEPFSQGAASLIFVQVYRCPAKEVDRAYDQEDPNVLRLLDRWWRDLKGSDIYIYTGIWHQRDWI